MKTTFNASRWVCLLALSASFMAISASAAQAEGTWLNNGVAITENTGISAESEIVFNFLFKVGLSKVEILCPKMRLSTGAVLTPGGGAEGKMHYEECITKLNGTAAAKCTPHSPGAAAGLIETNALDGSQRLNEGAQYLELLPVSGEAFVTLVMGAECAIGNNLEITGKAWLKDCEGKGLVDLVKHLLTNETILSSLRIGGATLSIDGSAWWGLRAPNTGHTFAWHV